MKPQSLVIIPKERKTEQRKCTILCNVRGFVICLWTDRIEDEISNDHSTMLQGLSSNLLGEGLNPVEWSLSGDSELLKC